MNDKEYIFGSENKELDRLGFQHKVWSEQAFSVWNRAGIRSTDIVLDVGAGPGFAALDLSYLVKKVVAIEKSKVFTNYLEDHCKSERINNIEVINQSIENPLSCNMIDIAYSRWVFSWLKNPAQALKNIAESIRKGGRIIFQEYCYWGALHLEPFNSEFAEFYKAARKSFDNDIGDVDIGYKIPELLAENGFRIIELKPLLKIGRPHSAAWNWVKTFIEIYGEKLITDNLLSEDAHVSVIKKLKELETREDAFISTPQMIEIIAEKL